MADQELDLQAGRFGDALVQELSEAKSGVHLTGTYPISVTGNAGTADKLKTPRAITLTGDVGATGSFDGSAPLSMGVTLNASGVTAGTYQNAQTIVPFTVDAKGRVTNVGAAVTIAPNWTSIQNRPTTIAAFGITDAAKNGANSDITSITGLTTPLAPNQGGTGLNSYTTGDLITASSSTTLAKIAAVANGNVLLSAGVGAIPVWGKVDLATHVTGALPVTSGGTGATTQANARTNLGLAIGSNVQAWNAQLDAISALAGTSGLVRKTSAITYSLDTTDYMPKSGGQFTDVVGAANSTGPIAQTNSGVAKLAVNSDGAANNAAFMVFNRSGTYAVYFGLDTDNKLKVGGYSMGAVSYEILHSGNFTPGNYLPIANGTLTGDTTLNNAVYLKAKNNTGSATRILGINAVNELYIGSIDDATVTSVNLNAGSQLITNFSTTGVTFSKPIQGNVGASFNYFRANQGAPNGTNGDDSTNGYAFGTDGDSGLFAIGTGPSSTYVAAFHNSKEVNRFLSSSGVMYSIVGAGTQRPITLAGGAGTISFGSDTGSWSNSVQFLGSSGTILGAYGAVGAGNTLTNLWIGPTYTAPWMTLDATNGIVQKIKTTQASTLGEIKNQTNTTTAGLVITTNPSGVVGTDGAFMTFVNKDGTKAFALGMDKDGEFKVGGGSIGSAAYKVYHEGYNPGAMISRGRIQFTDADLYRPTGSYQMGNPGDSASYSLLEFSDIGGSTSRIQFVAWYGGAGVPDEMYFRTARDSQTNWDSVPVLSNRVWHSGNLIPFSQTGGTITGDVTISKNTPILNLNTTTASTHAIVSYSFNGSTRWSAGKNNAPETGSNAGSNYDIRRYGDNSVEIETAMSINRANGTVTITRDLIVGSTSQFVYSNNFGVISSTDPLSFVNNSDFVWKKSVGGGGATLMTLNASGSLNVTGDISNNSGFYVKRSMPITAGDVCIGTHPYGVNQGDNRTHFGYRNSDGSFVNYIRGVTTHFDSAIEAKNYTYLGATIERVAAINAGSGSITHNYTNQAIWYHTGLTGNFTCALINVPSSNNNVVTATVVISQGATGYYPSAMTVNGSAATIRWAGGLTPVPSVNAVDVFTFNLMYVGGTLIVLGTFTPFG